MQPVINLHARAMAGRESLCDAGIVSVAHAEHILSTRCSVIIASPRSNSGGLRACIGVSHVWTAEMMLDGQQLSRWSVMAVHHAHADVM